MLHNILIICHGNTCRSPMAQLWLQKALPHHRISSAGIKAKQGLPMNAYAAKLVASVGIDGAHHQATQLTAQICNANQIIMVMEKSHIEAILSIDPTVKHKIVLVGKWQDDIEIADPYGQNFEIYKQCFDLIQNLTDKWVGKLK